MPYILKIVRKGEQGEKHTAKEIGKSIIYCGDLYARCHTCSSFCI